MINDSDNSVTAGARGARARRGAQRPAADLAHLSISNSLSSRHGELDHVPAVGDSSCPARPSGSSCPARAARGVVLSNSLAVSARWRRRVAARRPDDVAAGLVHKTQAAASAPRLAMALLNGLAFLAVSVWFGIGAMPAQAQSVTLVANIEQATADYTVAPVGWFSGSDDINWVQAQSFTTGSNARGYRLTSMTIALYKGDPDAALAVGIYTDSLGEPGEELYRLRGSVGSVGVTKFYAPRGADLDADTDYFLVLINDDGEHHYFVEDVTDSDQEDAGLALGFSIGNSRLEKWVSDSDPSSVWEELPQALKMAANGFAVVTADTTEPGRDELTAHVQDMPEAHDGQSSFKFALLFNQEVDGSYRDMRDHVLQISEGTVTNTRRLEPPSDRSWEYTVRPNADTDMTIVLPVTSDCAAVGAVCTEDGKRLSNGLTATVSGPGGLTATVSGPGSVLTAWFENVPESHDGSTAFTFELHFGEDIPGLSYTTVAGGLFEVTGANMTGARRLTRGSNQGWLVTVAPSGSEDLAISLPARACGETAAICVAGNRALSEGVSATVQMERPPGQEPRETLSARFENVPDSHDGSTPFTFDLHFSEAPEGLSYTTVAGGLLEVTGATVDKARRLTAGSNLAWEVTMTPSQSGDITITLPARACSEANAVCVGTRPLARAANATVRGGPLTASFSRVPAEHDGATAFDIRFHLSVEPAGLSYRTVQNGLFAVTGGSIEKASRLSAGKNNGWTLRILPSGLGDVTVRVNGTTACSTAPGVCTADGRKLAGGLSVSSAGPAALSVADAEVEEGADATLAFVVTLSKARFVTTTVQYATADGSATAGADYTLTSGTLTFGRLETMKTVSVPVLDDGHDEGSETITLTLSNASGARLGDATATGTITNSDPLPQALLARFGRTAAVHVVEQVQERIDAPREVGFEAQFAGRQLRSGMEREMAAEFLSRLAPSLGANRVGAGVQHPMSGSTVADRGAFGTPGLPDGASMAANPMGRMPGTDGGLNPLGHFGMGLRGGNMLTGSAFELSRETRRGGILSWWSRGAQSQFAGREGELSLDGRVSTTMAGADYAAGPLVAGLSLSHSRGRGGYEGVDIGEVTSSVTGLYPWLGYKATDRISLWGLTGYGKGALTLTPGAGAALQSGLSMAMAAGGLRGELAASLVGGFGLAFKADALWVGTGIEGVDGPEGRLAAAAAAVTRFRTVLEASRSYSFERGLSLQPSLDVGLRRDGGDAETGAGVDIGGGLIVSDRSTGLSADVRVRMLLAHQDEGFRERGLSVSFSFDPTPSTPLGFMAKVTPSLGGQAAGGAQALWGQETMAGMPQGGVASGNRLEAELGYGMPVGSRLVGMPRFGIGTSEYGRDYRLGYGLTVAQSGAMSFELGIDAARRESPVQGGAEHGVQGRLTARW